MSRPAHPNDFSVWLASCNDSPAAPNDPQPTSRRAQAATTSNECDATKALVISFVDGTRLAEHLFITPRTTARDILTQLHLGPGFQLGAFYELEEVIYPARPRWRLAIRWRCCWQRRIR
jgi:hypothetical protein